LKEDEGTKEIRKGPAWNQKDVTKTGNEEGEVVDWVYEAGV